MRPHPRTRKTIKWAGAAALVLLLAAWLYSKWRAVLWSDGNGLTVGLGGGAVVGVKSPDFIEDRGLAMYRAEEMVGGLRLQWLPEMQWRPRDKVVVIPLWLAALPLLLATAAAWRLDTLARRRLRAGTPCPTCNYDLTGLPTAAATCPECGASRAAAPA